MFASEHFITPDVLVLGKSMGGAHAMSRLNELKNKHPLIGNIAGVGLHMGIDRSLFKSKSPPNQ